MIKKINGTNKKLKLKNATFQIFKEIHCPDNWFESYKGWSRFKFIKQVGVYIGVPDEQRRK